MRALLKDASAFLAMIAFVLTVSVALGSMVP